jgi:hypothetical protein
MARAFTMPYPDSGQTDAWNEKLVGTTILWVEAPSGMFLMLSGGWAVHASAVSFAVRAGYDMIDTDEGLGLLDQQMADALKYPRLRAVKH